MNKYTVEVNLKGGRKLVEKVEAMSKILAHAAMFQKYGDEYTASEILDEPPDEEDPYECPRCHNTKHMMGAKFCMICGSPIKREEKTENADESF